MQQSWSVGSNLKTGISVWLYSFTFLTCLMLADAFGDVTFTAGQYPDLSALWKEHKLDLVLTLICLISWFFCHKFKAQIRNIELEDKVLGNHITGQFLTWIALAIGIYSSVTSSAFLQWFSPAANAVGQAKYGIDLVLGFIALTLFGFIKHGSHVADKAKQQDKQQAEYINELHETIRLAPPRTFPHRLALYADVMEDFAVEVTVSEWSDYLQKPENERLAQCEDLLESQRSVIRACLVALARLAGHYDNAPLGNGSNLQYRANLMLTTHAQNPQRLAALGEEKDFEHRFNIGVEATPQYQLILDKRYSVLVDSDDVSIIDISEEDTHTKSTASFKACQFLHDDKVKNAIFPVYWSDEQSTTHNYYNMIGAPDALATCQPQFIPDTIRRAKELGGAGYSAPLAKQAVEYFTNDEKGRSIVSLPISSQRFMNHSLKPAKMVGVVNIYRNKKDIFSGNEKNFSLFCDFTLPLQLALARIISMHIAVLEDKADLQQNAALQKSEDVSPQTKPLKNNGNQIADEIY